MIEVMGKGYFVAVFYEGVAGWMEKDEEPWGFVLREQIVMRLEEGGGLEQVPKSITLVWMFVDVSRITTYAQFLCAALP